MLKDQPGSKVGGIESLRRKIIRSELKEGLLEPDHRGSCGPIIKHLTFTLGEEGDKWI